MASTQQSQCHPDTDSKNEMEVVDQKKRGRTKQKAKCHCLALCSFAFNFENSQQSRQAIRNALLKWKQCKWWQQWKLLGSAETVIPTTCWNKPILPWKGAKKMKYIYIYISLYIQCQSKLTVIWLLKKCYLELVIEYCWQNGSIYTVLLCPSSCPALQFQKQK